MNPVLKAFIGGWAIATGLMAGILLVLLPMFDLFPWIRLNGVLWFGGFLAVVLLGMYGFGRMLGYIPDGSAGQPTGQRRQSKGARER